MAMFGNGTYVRIQKLNLNDELITLDIICSWEKEGLWQYFSSNEEMHKFITEDTIKASQLAMHKQGEKHYILNIESATKDFYCGYFGVEGKQRLKMLEIFMPVIKKFLTQ